MRNRLANKIYTVNLLCVLFAITVLSAWMSLPVKSARNDGIEFVVNSTMGTDSVRQMPLTTNDLIYNPTDNSFYASVPSSAGSTGNSLASRRNHWAKV